MVPYPANRSLIIKLLQCRAECNLPPELEYQCPGLRTCHSLLLWQCAWQCHVYLKPYFSNLKIWKLPLTNRPLLNAFFVIFALENALYKNSRRVDHIRVKLTGWNKFFYFGNGDFTGSSHHWVEIAGSSFIDQVTGGIAFPGFYKGKIGFQPLFHQVHFSVEFARFFAFAHFGSVAGRGKESRDAG